MTIRTKTLVYDGPGGPFEGVVAWDDEATGPRPGVLVTSNFMGQGPADVARAARLAAIGYVGFSIDMYGQGKRGHDMESASGLMAELTADRHVLQARIAAALDTLKGFDEVDANRTAAIGFCLGGKCVLDLARSGADVAAVVSFHGVYDPPPFPNAATISAKVLILHGWEDPLCPPDATVALAAELTASGADWQIHAYGRTGHAFTAPEANAPGMSYSPSADRRSWQSMTNLFHELWG